MGDFDMQTKVITATGDAELEQKINSFIIGKNVIDIKLTEWVSYKDEHGAYTAFVLYAQGVPTRQVQARLIAVVSEVEIEQQVNAFISNKQVVDIKYTEWGDFDSQTGGYTALIIYISESRSESGAIQQPQAQPQSTTQTTPQFNAI